MKHFEYTLPSGYKQAKVIDAGSKKLGIILNLIALLVTAIIVGATVLILKPQNIMEDMTLDAKYFLRLAIYFVILFGYIVLHELVHGAAYKLLTKQKLKFGMTLTVAYCGVPDIFVYRKAALIALLAPFTVFLPLFAAPIFLLAADVDKIFCAFMLGMHIGGCSGDLYISFLYAVKFKDPSVLMQDTGPKQIFYVKETAQKQDSL